MKILIAGASGMLGSVLFDGYKSDHIVYGFGRSQVNKENYITADITDYSKVETIIKNIRPDVIINCAAMIDVEKCEQQKDAAYLINATSAGNLSYLSEKYKSRIVYISTNMVFKGNGNAAYTEVDLPIPVNWYGNTKHHGEAQTYKFCKRHTIIRTNIFGWKSFGHWLYDGLTTNKSIKLYTDIYFNCLYVKDMIKPIENLINSPSGIYHVTSRDYMSKYEFGQEMARSIGESKLLNRHIGHIKYNQNSTNVGRPAKAILNCNKYEGMFGKLPTISETIKHFLKDNPYGKWEKYE